MTQGWAMESESGDIDLRTIHDSERGSKVNGICVLHGIMPMDDWSDNFINEVWRACEYKYKTKIIKVFVEKAS